MMSDRKRKYTWNNNVKQKNVEPGLTGLLFTVDGLEKLALKEAYNLIDEILEEDGSVHVDPADVHKAAEAELEEYEGDVSDILKKSCSESRDGHIKVFRCRQRPTGVKNCLFVTVKDADVLKVAERMVEISQHSPRCRYLQRVFPVEGTADFDLPKLSELISKSVSKHLVPDADGNYPSYALEFKTRNNDSLKKTIVLQMLDEVVNAVAPLATVDLKNADVVFFVQLVRKTLMIGAMKKFYERRKYSLRTVSDGGAAAKHNLRPVAEVGAGGDNANTGEIVEPRELIDDTDE